MKPRKQDAGPGRGNGGAFVSDESKTNSNWMGEVVQAKLLDDSGVRL